jgi:hypothetical protein
LNLNSDRDGTKRHKIHLDPESKDLALDILNEGLDEMKKRRIKDLTKFQRVGVLQTIFDRLFKNKKLKSEIRVKHGHG